MLAGGCYCGAVRYEVTGKPVHLTNCHCSICRRTTGAPYVSWFSVPVAQFRIVQGSPVTFHSSQKALRRFCGTCGTQLIFQHEEDVLYIDLTAGSLDDPESCPPEDHTYLGDKLGWVNTADHLPGYVRSRSAG